MKKTLIAIFILLFATNAWSAGKISDLGANSTPAGGDLIETVDVSDPSMAATGTNTKTTVTELFATPEPLGATTPNAVSATTATVSTSLTGTNAAGPNIINEAATATNPTLIPNKAEEDTGFGWAAADTLTAITGGTEALRIDSAQNTLIGNGNGMVIGGLTQQTVAGTIPELQVLGTGTADSSIVLGRWSANATAPFFHFLKSRNGTIGSNTIVSDDDVLGEILWQADDGVDYTTEAAFIRAAVDGTPGANDMPTRLEFGVTADGNASASTALTIENDGDALFAQKVGIGGSPSSYVEVRADQNAMTDYDVQNNTSDTAAGVEYNLTYSGGSGVLRGHSAGFTTSNQYQADSILLEASSSSGGLILSAAGGAFPIEFWNNSTLSGQFEGDGDLFLASGNKLGIGISPTSPLHINLGTENLEVVDSGSAAATEQDWIEVEVGGNQGYIRVFAAK